MTPLTQHVAILITFEKRESNDTLSNYRFAWCFYHWQYLQTNTETLVSQRAPARRTHDKDFALQKNSIIATP